METFAWFKENGVDIKVISGDSARTVSAIAAEAGISNADKYISLEGMSNEQVKEIATQYTVFGRVTPEQKEVLVIALKEAKHTVAMTGDGVNDILALKRSDCSIAMASGADAAKNISHIILIDSNFSRLPAVVDEGRRVVNNLQRTASLFVTKTFFIFMITLVFTIATIVNKDIHYPFITNHLYLWEIFTTGFAAFALAMEKNSERIHGHFLSNVFKKAIPAAVVLVSSVLLIFLFYLLQEKGLANFGIYNRGCAIAMSVITFSVLGIVCLYRVCSPLDKYRAVVLACSAVVNAVALILSAIFTYKLGHVEQRILRIPFTDMSGPAYLTMAIIIIVYAALYLYIYRLIEIKKGEHVKE